MSSRSSAGSNYQRFARYGGRPGRMAEAKVEEVFPKYLHMGFDNPDWSDGTRVAGALPIRLTAMPDFLVDHDGEVFWVEAKGCKGTWAKLKLRDLEHLEWWQEAYDLPVRVLFWNSGRKEWAVIPVSALRLYVETEDPSIGAFPQNGIEYYNLRWVEIRDLAHSHGKS